MRHVILIRGVNVGANTVDMADLRALLEELGHSQVRTHLRSGNAVVTAGEEDPAAVAAAVERAILDRLGLALPVMVRTAPELRAVVEANPLDVREPSKMVVAFLGAAPDPGVVAGIDHSAFAPEELRPAGREAYLYFPGGLGRARLSVGLEKLLGVPATLRNWNTVTKLLDLAEQPG
jgi:uncharacterized protein (DUF1697 family)